MIFRANVTLTWCYNIQCYNIVLVLIAGDALVDDQQSRGSTIRHLKALQRMKFRNLVLRK